MSLFRPSTIPFLLESRVKESPEAAAYFFLDDDNHWQSESWSDFYNKVLTTASIFHDLGISNGQHAAIMASTSLQWEICHHALLSIGCTVVGIDPRESAKNIQSILAIAEINILLVDHSQQLEMLDQTIIHQLPLLISLSARPCGAEKYHKHYYYSALLEKKLTILKSKIKANRPSAEDIATIIFTSGTTGTPKGIAYRHEQIIFTCEKILQTFPDIKQNFRFACWLPLSNLFQRIVNLSAIVSGSSCYFISEPKRLLELLPQINPHIFISVPRFFEKLYEGFEAKLNKLNPVARTLIFFILKRAEAPGITGYLFRRTLSPIVKPFKKIFGNNILFMISGSAPMPLWLLKRYFAMDILILEAYGMSENVLPIAMNTPTGYQFGSVGKIVAGNQVKLSDDNELLVKGFGLFTGYLDHDNNHALNTALDTEGFLPSGDYAQINANGFIILTGRKSEVFKTSTGQKIAPASIEIHLNQLVAVDQAIITGAGKKFPVAIVTLSELSRNNGIEEIKAISTSINKAIQGLPRYKSPAGLVISRQPFSLTCDEITANLKLKRAHILKNFKQPLDKLYTELETPQSSIHQSPLSINDDLILVKL